MLLEVLPVRSPALPLKFSLATDTVHSTIGHVESVMRVVMREESLAAEGNQVFKTADPVIQQRKVVFEAALIYWIRVGQTARYHLKRLRAERDFGGAKRLTNQLPQFRISLGPRI